MVSYIIHCFYNQVSQVTTQTRYCKTIKFVGFFLCVCVWILCKYRGRYKKSIPRTAPANILQSDRWAGQTERQNWQSQDRKTRQRQDRKNRQKDETDRWKDKIDWKERLVKDKTDRKIRQTNKMDRKIRQMEWQDGQKRQDKDKNRHKCKTDRLKDKTDKETHVIPVNLLM